VRQKRKMSGVQTPLHYRHSGLVGCGLKCGQCGSGIVAALRKRGVQRPQRRERQHAGTAAHVTGSSFPPRSLSTSQNFPSKTLPNTHSALQSPLLAPRIATPHKARRRGHLYTPPPPPPPSPLLLIPHDARRRWHVYTHVPAPPAPSPAPMVPRKNTNAEAERMTDECHALTLHLPGILVMVAAGRADKRVKLEGTRCPAHSPGA